MNSGKRRRFTFVFFVNCLFDSLRIVVRSDSLGLVVSLNSRNSCHSEKTENLASSIDFRLIQNLLMLIFYVLRGLRELFV